MEKKSNQVIKDVVNFLDTFYSNYQSNYQPLEFNLFREPNVKINTYQDDKNYLFEVSVPGFNKEDLNIDLTDGNLTISGSHTDNNNDKKYFIKEFFKTKFERKFKIPSDKITGDVDAKLENGILYISLSKKLNDTESKKIVIK